MKFFILTICCNLLSSGHLQEINNGEDYNVVQPDAGKGQAGDWPLETIHTIQGNFYGQAQTNVPKPCTRRSNSGIDQQLSPILEAKVDKPLTNGATAALKPQALRNGDYNLKISKNQEFLSSAQLNNDDSNLHKTRNSLSVSNPVIDSLEENHHEIILPINKEILEDTNSKPTSEVSATARRNFHSVPSSIHHFVPTNVYGAESDNQYMSEHNELRSTINNDFHSDPNSLLFSSPTSEFHSVKKHTLPSVPVNAFHLEPDKQESATKITEAGSALNKCSHDKEPDNLIGHSRRSMTSYNDDETAMDNLSNDKDILRSHDDSYIESHIDNENAMASVLNVEPNYQKPNKDQSLRILDKSKSPNPEKSISRVGRPQFNEARREMMEPTRSSGVTNMGQSSLMMMQTERICYACSTANNPTCWAPDRRTTVKYCRKGNNACITKTFGSGSTFTLIRDCGRSCDDSDMGGLMPKYKSCAMCHSELCNGAYSINGHSIIFALFLIALIKYLN